MISTNPDRPLLEFFNKFVVGPRGGENRKKIVGRLMKRCAISGKVRSTHQKVVLIMDCLGVGVFGTGNFEIR
jgi:hypothetical protein